MTQRSLLDLGLTVDQCAVLAGLGVASQRELALQFYLQPDMLANLLTIDQREAGRMVQEAATSVSQAELDRLVREAQRPRTFGVLAPPGDQSS
jgi:predicted RecB family nuclease